MKKKIEVYNRISNKMYYVSDGILFNEKQRLYSEMLDATYLMHKKGFTPGEIAEFLDIPESGITNILKQLKCNISSDDAPAVKILPGVTFNEETNDYTAYVQVHDETINLGTYKTKFRAAVARYQYDSDLNTPAAKYIMKQCGKLECDFCYEHGLKLLPMVCKRAKRIKAAKSTETHAQFLTRAKKIVKGE